MKSLREWDPKGVLANYLKSITQMRTDGFAPVFVCEFRSLNQSVQKGKK